MAGTITHEWNGTILTITSDSGTTAMDLKGEKGDTGARGARGLPGKSGGGARIEDGVISDETTWSSSGIIDRFAELMGTNANPAVLDNPYPNYPLQITTTFDIKQEGSGEPYPAGVGKNLFDYKSYSSKNSNIEITISGDNVRMYTTSDGTYRGLKYESFTAVAGTSYTGSFTLNKYVSGVMTFGLRDASTNTFLVSKKVTNTGSYSFTYTPTANVEVYPSILVTNDSILSGDVTFSNVQLEVGSTATEYAPYSNIRPISGFNSAKLTRCGKNLLKNTATTQTVNGITFTVNSDGTVKANGTATATAILTLVTSTSNPELRDALLGNQITISGCPSGGSSKTYDLRIYQYADASSYLMDYGSGKTATFTNAELPFNVAILIRSGVKVNNLVFRPQIELGSTATAYEPYQGDTFTIALGDTYYGGMLDWNSGEMVVDKMGITLNGNEEWTKSIYGNHYNMPLTDIVPTDENINHIVCCSHCIGIPYVDRENYTNLVVGITNDNKIEFRNTEYETIEGWKAYLAAQNTAGTPIQIVYKLATQTTIQLTPQEIKAIKGINILYSNAQELTVISRVDTMYQLSKLAERVAALEAR